MEYIEGDFPYEEIRDHNGDYFRSPDHAMTVTGLSENHIWSVTEGDEDVSVFLYGPSHHYINLIGYIATKEEHDGNTYYEEKIDMS